jgi:hypothetical protein
VIAPLLKTLATRITTRSCWTQDLLIWRQCLPPSPSLNTPLWRYCAEKCNAEMETEPVHCPVGADLVQYLANREQDRKRSQSNPRRKRNNLEWCRQQEDLHQEYIHNVLRTGLSKEGGGDGVPFTASPAVGITNLHVMLSGKPLTFYLVVMLLMLYERRLSESERTRCVRPLGA